MGCGASSGAKYEETSAIDKLAAAQQVAETIHAPLDVDRELLDKLFVKNGEKSGSILANDLTNLLRSYAKINTKTIEGSMTSRVRISEEHVKAVEAMNDLESAAETYAKDIIKALGVAKDGEITREAFDVEFVKLMDVYTEIGGDASHKGKGRSASKGVHAINPELLKELWIVYDLNKDNALDGEELHSLLLDYCEANRKKIEEGATTKTGRIIMSDEHKKGMKAMEHLNENATQYSAQLLPAMDLNGDGDVEQAEFLDKFPDIWNKIIEQCRKAVSSEDSEHATKKHPT